ncbi:MAG: hypothetical protein WDZ82_03825 [Candidatus Paceibacterota bacterium]
MGRKLVYTVLGISVVVFLFAVVFLLFSDQQSETSDLEFETVSTSTDTEDGSSSETDVPEGVGSQATTTVNADVFDEEKAQGSCVSEHEEELEEQNYTEGSLLVAFESDIEFNDARRIIEVEGASFGDEDSAESSFDDQGWLEVSVTEGEEARYMCRFERYPEVRSVRANMVFELHE